MNAFAKWKEDFHKKQQQLRRYATHNAAGNTPPPGHMRIDLRLDDPVGDARDAPRACEVAGCRRSAAHETTTGSWCSVHFEQQFETSGFPTTSRLRALKPSAPVLPLPDSALPEDEQWRRELQLQFRDNHLKA